MQSTFLVSRPSEVNPDNIGDALQQAIEIEIATIPVYLFTYYSINRTPTQDTITDELKAALLAQNKPGKPKYTEQAASEIALDLSAKIMVFANKAGASILSVVIEEMLHMSLSSNVKQALVGNPQLVDKGPSVWPAYLPGHEPAFPINRAKFSQDQLFTFMQIESPKELEGKMSKAEALPYITIGQFYSMIEKCIKKHFKDDDCYHTKRPQLVPKMGYYAQNDIDTLYYDKQHKPKFENAEDSGDLVHVVDKKSALKALDIIVDQGEGHAGGHQFKVVDGKDCVDCAPFTDGSFDDKQRSELAHFDKFNQLWCEMGQLDKEFEKYFGDKIDPKSYYIYNFAENPVTADYPEIIQKVSTLTNAVYSYLYVMTQACYHAEKNTQYEIFMFGIHKSMMWILGTLCGTLPGMKYIDKDGFQRNAAPTFENYSFNTASSPKQQIIELFNQAAAAYPGIAHIKDRIHDLPNVPLEGYLAKPGQPILA
ncbi:ferritin-like protein [Paraneptunicella aestuarii]|uniref:ferritin-like protein n=1 Tax=Paraneptunicella aestuarii TaxID=2831148 RepID=UPI001E2ECB4C|nr:ferritin-like protein [Paraneptunicella aestuarii]UAA39000.1 ferritin-like protein [Paraneptunicella aestuarii]